MNADLNQSDTQVVDGGTTAGGGVDAEVRGDKPAEGGVTEADIDAVDALLNDVEQSLSRLDAGTYGRCEECGEPIDEARLAELPTARTCGACPV
ncbi:MAG TPA: TraR/DksA family transcriptional regulator [Acidimicrobiales bacterium]|nr:TraR/DksA family transcriptional regulator [Acidimicrobiales bacterium]